MKVTIHAAKTDLSKLIEAALAGEEVIIAKGAKPVVRLVPIQESKFKLGILEGKVPPGGPDFLAPMTDDEIKDWEGR